MPEISPARRAAFRILLEVERGPSHSDELLRSQAVNALSPADRNLVTALVLGVLRWQIRIDQELKHHLARPGGKLDLEVLIALRLGAFQLLYLDRIPAHAAIGESVELVKRAGHRFASGMVNAVLRKMALAKKSEESAVEQAGNQTEAAKAHMQGGRSAGLKSYPDASSSSGTAAHPDWMVERWTALYGAETACAICRHGQAQPALSLRIEDPETESELIQAGIQLAPGELLTAARTMVSGDVIATIAFRDGRVRFQDEGSQFIAELAACAAGELDQCARSILDACAAPGGKTLILAERCPEARIVACESSSPRFEQLRNRLAVYSSRVECRLADVAQLQEDRVFDLALADVPCSGTGTLGRNPEIRHRLRAEDLARHAERQKAILSAAIRAVRPGGRIVYSTCSLEPEENEQVVAEVLAQTSGVHQVSLESTIASLLNRKILTQRGAEQLRTCFTPKGALRLIPGILHTDGFLIALLQKLT